MTSVFTWLVGNWFANFAFAHHISNSWCATRNPVPDSTYHLADLKGVTAESQNVSPCMTATPWRRVNWKMCDENSTFACFDAICTQFNVTWPHCGTVRDFFGTFNWLIAVMNRIFHSEMAVTARAGGACTQFKTKHQSKRQRVLPSYMALQKSQAINGFDKCVFGFYSHWKVWHKSKKAFGMCSDWHYTTRGLAYGDMTTRPTGSLSCLHPPISLVV